MDFSDVVARHTCDDVRRRFYANRGLKWTDCGNCPACAVRRFWEWQKAYLHEHNVLDYKVVEEALDA